MCALAAQNENTQAADSSRVDRLCAEYGSRRGFAQSLLWNRLVQLGALRRARRIDWTCVDRFVFVCRGNICRSPYAARRARAMSLRASSAGIDIGDNDAIHSTAMEVAARRGLDLSKHKPRDLGQLPLSPSDLLVVMEPAQLRAAAPLAHNAYAQITLLGLWSTPRRVHLTDPYGLDEEYFNRCFMLIDSALSRLAADWQEARHAAAGE